MRTRTIIALFLAATLTTLSATRSPLAASNSNKVVAQSPIPMLTGTTQPIAIGSADQTNPSVSCDLACYTNDDLEGSSTVRYFDFATNTEHVVPGNGLDRLSDTDGRRVAFTRLDGSGDHVGIYDIASQTTSFVPGNQNGAPAIGGNLIAFMHGPLFITTPDIEVYDQNTGIVTQLTNDTLSDWRPSVSPDGNVVVWEKCQQANVTGCDIYAATQTGPGAFTTRQLTSAGENHSADTNGQVVVYISNKGGENDVYVQRVDGSTEMHLSIPDDQRDVRISGNLVVFESKNGTDYDVFLYDLSSARLFQVTNTPDISETLSDVVAGCNGVNRIVYVKPGFGAFDVWGFNFQLNDSVLDQLTDLMALVQSFNLHDGTETSLLSKLQDAITAVNASDTATACDSLTAFINASQAQLGKKLTADQVNQLVAAAAQIKTDLGCQ